jgi:hypothetical protein
VQRLGQLTRRTVPPRGGWHIPCGVGVSKGGALDVDFDNLSHYEIMINVIPLNSLYSLVVNSILRELLTNMHLHGPQYRYELRIMLLIFIVISSWIISIRMRRKIKKDLGRKANNLDLTSIDTWMKVDEVEHEDNRKKPIEPD